ncbi:MAG: HNH endonuclease, partial [Humidesulfovibrio sp.]|nr:HNH endonuclease [Humidesulfovibrio sp.]
MWLLTVHHVGVKQAGGGNMTTTQNSTETTCIYCNSLRSNAEFSLEHIFPAALGGKSCGDIFKTRCVCNKCNNILGLFVDGAFMKSWFTTNGAAASAFNYLDRVDGGIVPYTYIGSIPDLSDENNLYEFWVGPSGENVYTR